MFAVAFAWPTAAGTRTGDRIDPDIAEFGDIPPVPAVLSQRFRTVPDLVFRLTHWRPPGIGEGAAGIPDQTVVGPDS